jgi:type I restriction enzyme S subunit
LLSVYRDYGVVPKSSRDDNYNKPSEDLSAYQLVEPGDLVINKMKAWQGSVAVSNYRGIVSPAYFVYRPTHSANSRYLHYLLRSEQYVFGYRTLSKGIRINQWDLEPEEHSRMPLLLPPEEEQQMIAAYLDVETSKIDVLVAEQQRLISLLREKRLSVLSDVITRGLDSNVTMRDSGEPFIGSIPAHWQVLPLMRLTPEDRQIMYGIVLPGPDVEGGVPIVKGGDVKPDRLRLERLNRTTHEIEAGYVRSRLKGGDLVYAIRGSIGEVEMVPEELTGANLTQDAARVAPRAGVSGKWLLYALRSAAVFGQLDRKATGATIRGINIFDLKRARVPTPPLAEQERIAECLQAQDRTFVALIAEAERSIALLRERRTSLISTAVTGTVDVGSSEPNLEPVAA